MKKLLIVAILGGLFGCGGQPDSISHDCDKNGCVTCDTYDLNTDHERTYCRGTGAYAALYNSSGFTF
jgi:hypothetical protein